MRIYITIIEHRILHHPFGPFSYFSSKCVMPINRDEEELFFPFKGNLQVVGVEQTGSQKL